mgnify:CR=1 FL=1
MPGGGLIQLITCGLQDSYLTGNPDVSYFKYVYKKHTKFSNFTNAIKSQDQINTFAIRNFSNLLKSLYKLKLLDSLKLNFASNIHIDDNELEKFKELKLNSLIEFE